MRRREVSGLASCSLCVLALLLAPWSASLAAPSPAPFSAGQTPPAPVVYKSDGNGCPREDSAIGGGSGRDVTATQASSAVLLKLGNHETAVRQALYSADGQTIFTVDQNIVRFWDARSGKNLKKFDAGKGMLSAAFSPKDQTIAVASSGGIRLMDPVTGKTIRTIKSSDGTGSEGVAYSSDGRLIAGYSGPVAYVWDTSTGRQLWRFAARGARPGPNNGGAHVRYRGPPFHS